ncbi:hypothetical protein E9993_01220 [Labilibacter sediminis]|nr:hypothetical protein E9993_01220 [Labilibacter sediminis]
MNSNFTADLAKLEEYSLALINFFDKMPDSFFNDETMQPSERTVNNILNYSKGKKKPFNNDSRIYRYMVN